MGCEACEGGSFSLADQCPKAYCQPIAEAVWAYTDADKYGLPVEGGTLDQSAWFMDLVRWFGNEEARFELESVKE